MGPALMGLFFGKKGEKPALIFNMSVSKKVYK